MWWLDHLLRAQFARPSGPLGSLVIGPALNVTSVPLVNAALDELAILPRHRVLDIGFGAGYSVLAASRRAHRVTGIDYSWDMVSATARLVRGSASATLCCGDVMRLPFPAASFDKALSANSIYYWPDPLAGLREVHRVLRPGGRFVAGVRSPARLRPLTWSWDNFRTYEPDELAGLFSQAGYRDVVVRHLHRWLPLDTLLVAGRRP